MKAALLLVLVSAGLGAAPFDKGGLLGVGAREAGQGGAVVARVADSEALWWNPAGLDLDKRRGFDLGLHYGDVLGASAFDTAFDHRGWIEPLALGYGLGYRHVGFQAGAVEEEIGLGVAFPFTEDQRLLTGLALRSLSTKLTASGINARGYGLDLGLSYHPGILDEALTLGLALRDLQAGLEWSTGVSANPVQLFQLGAAWAFDPETSAEFDAEMASDPASGSASGQGFKIGAERWWSWKKYNLMRLAALRLGYSQTSALAPTALGGQFSFGLGLQFEGARLDYAFSQDVSSLGPTHRVSGGYRFGQIGEGATPTPLATPTLTPTTTATAVVAAVSGTSQAIDLTVTVAPALFNPLSRGSRLTWSLSAAGALSSVASTVLQVLPNLGDAVYTQAKRGFVAEGAWDGRQSSGSWPAPGGYKAQVSLVDAQGLTLAASSAKFQLDLGGGTLRLLPEADIFAPIAQSARPNAILVVGYQGADAKRWTLSITREGSAKPVRVLSGPKLPARLLWDGKDRQKRSVPDGGYNIELQLVTAVGKTLTAQTRVDVDTRRPTVNLEANPLVFEAKGDVGSVTFNLGVAGEAGIPANWTLSIETLHGKTLKSFAGKGAPPQQVVWNGVDEAGKLVPGGSLYYAGFVVEMESGALARQPRLALASKAAEPAQPFRVPLQSLRFEEGDEVIALEDYKSLKEASAAVKKYSSDYVVVVNGYAASGESSKSGLSELELSFLRAKAVRDFLVEGEGLDPAKVKSAGLGTEGGAVSGDLRKKARHVEIILYAQ